MYQISKIRHKYTLCNKRRKDEWDSICVRMILEISKIADELNGKSEALRNSIENISATIEETTAMQEEIKERFMSLIK